MRQNLLMGPNGQDSLVMHALDINRFTMTVAVFWDRNQVCSMHIKGYIVISMRHVTGNLVPFKDFASSGSMPHGNNYGLLKMHARDFVLHVNRLTMTVAIFLDINQVCSLHIMGCMIISIWHMLTCSQYKFTENDILPQIKTQRGLCWVLD